MSPRLLWGGPGTGGDSLQAPNFLVGMLEHVKKMGKATKLDFVQWHEKGYLAMAGGKDSNTHTDIAIANALVSAGVDPSMPIGNEEVDPLGGWNHIEQWRGDAQYGNFDIIFDPYPTHQLSTSLHAPCGVLS